MLLCVDEIGHVLHFLDVDELPRAARVSTMFSVAACALATEIWHHVRVDLLAALSLVVPTDVRLQGIVEQLARLQFTPFPAEIDFDSPEHWVDYERAYEEAADDVVFYAERAHEIVVTQASPLACLLFDARTLTLFATGALRLLRNPWRTAAWETIHRLTHPDEPTKYVADGDAFQETVNRSRISEGLLEHARLEASAEFAQSLAPQRKLQFLKFLDGGLCLDFFSIRLVNKTK